MPLVCVYLNLFPELLTLVLTNFSFSLSLSLFLIIFDISDLLSLFCPLILMVLDWLEECERGSLTWPTQASVKDSVVQTTFWESCQGVFLHTPSPRPRSHKVCALHGEPKGFSMIIAFGFNQDIMCWPLEAYYRGSGPRLSLGAWWVLKLFSHRKSLFLPPLHSLV